MDAIFFIDILGTFVFAISGVMAAIERKFDLFGTIILALVTAVGGGTLRDILIGDTPVSWLQSDIHIYVILGTIPVTYFFSKELHNLRKTFRLFDTLGIGLFTILGLEKSLAMDFSPLVAVMMGVVSAVFGGVTRDVLSSQVPLIFRKEVYASACFAGACMYLLLNYFEVIDSLKLILSIGVVIAIRMLALRKGWNIPFKPLRDIQR